MFKQCPCCRKWLPIGIAICICGIVLTKSGFDDKKMPDHAHQESPHYFHDNVIKMSIGTSTASLSANFNDIYGKYFSL